MIDYLTRYEQRYDLPVIRPVRIDSIESTTGHLRLNLSYGQTRTAKAVVSATGTYGAPYIPDYPGHESFNGTQLHSAQYRNPDDFVGKRLLVVGGGNSAAQIHAEISQHTRSTWVTVKPPDFLPDDVDGHVLFARATERLQDDYQQSSTTTLGDIVMVPPVKAARERGDLATVRPFRSFTETGVIWQDGTAEPVDAVIWCTGFGPATGHLESLGVVEADGRVEVEDQRSVKEPRLWLAGYGNWTGGASATLIGSSRTARELVPRIAAVISGET